MEYVQLNDIIKSSKNILIISHLNPDGDTLGSMCGLYSAIYDNFKKKPSMLLMSKLPEVYTFLPYVLEAKHISDYDKSREFDLVINVDVASYDRMFESEVLFSKAKYRVNIDHHITNNGYADMNVVKPEASSTGEVLFDIMEDLGWKVSLNTAKCLYTAILTDTGSFRFSNTSSRSLEVVSKLVALGVRPSELYKYCYESNSKEHVLFQAYCISKAIFSSDNKIAYIIIYKKDMEKFNVGDDCTEGLTEKLRAIKPVEVAFIVKQLSANASKISMRSETAGVSEVCANFGGGGHKLAAGCMINSPVEDAAQKVLNEVLRINL